jgi:hypothetical protein
MNRRPMEKFADLARKLAAVPKKELDQKRAEKPKRKKAAG